MKPQNPIELFSPGSLQINVISVELLS